MRQDDPQAAEKIVAERFYVAEGRDGEFYPIYPLAQILLAVPFYAAGAACQGLAREQPEDVIRMGFAVAMMMSEMEGHEELWPFGLIGAFLGVGFFLYYALTRTRQDSD